jgi:hypothetical protein
VPEDKQRLLAHYRRTRAEFLPVIEGIGGELMAEPSIDGWSVKDHLAHIAFWDELRAGDMVRISAGHDSSWKLSPEDEDSLNELAYRLRRSWSREQAMWELHATRERMLEALEAATPRALDGSLYGEASLVSSHEVEHGGWIRRWRQERGI